MKDIDKVLDFRQEYLSHCDINEYIDSLQTKYPELVHVKTIGYSFEKRALKSIHISTSAVKLNEPQSIPLTANSTLLRTTSERIQRFSANTSSAKRKTNLITNRKPVIFIDGGMHAREWCTISAALYCASQLIENFDANKDLVNAFDFVIVPIVNADGYEYSRQFQKMWRKSRRPISRTKFVGVDFNRNFSVGWEIASSKISSYTYRGEKPFSEPETRIIKHLMHSLKPMFYLTLHSFHKSIMFPYAFTSAPPAHWMKLHRLAKAGYSAIQRATGSEFHIGSVSSVLKKRNKIGGGSLDYAYKMAKIPFVIAMELSGGSFHPPSNAIKDVISESWIGIRAMCSFLKTKI